MSEQPIEPTRGLVAILMLHDIAPWALWCNAKPFEDAFDALDAFGYTDSDFIPYFDRQPPAATDMRDVYVSVYKRDDGRALAIVGNTSRESRAGVVRLDAKRIGVSADQVISWPDRAPATREGDGLKLEVPGQGYRMLLIGKPPAEK